MRPQVALVNLGCRVNRVETDLMAEQLEAAGCELVGQADAQVVVINTCVVTGEAQVKTRKAVRRAAHLSQRPIVIATGCAAMLFSDELVSIGTNVVVERNKAAVAGRVICELDATHAVDEPLPHAVIATTPTPTGRTRPGVKIQDGCDYRCSYCIVWQARGPSRSMPTEDVVHAVRAAVERGAHEVVLTGINLGRFRTEDADVLGGGRRLGDLLIHLLAHTDVDRIRLSSIEPQDVDDELLQVMAQSNGRIAPFLHICLQSGCDPTLARMRRTYTTAQYASVVARARELMPRIAVETDLIVGFPGETDEEFAESLAFCESMGFSRMHVFRYSKRPGTPAASAPDQVGAQVSAHRSELMRAMATRSRERQMSACDGTTDHVVVQEPGEAVDSRLFEVSVAKDLPPGSWVPMRLSWRDQSLWGVPLDA